VLLLLGRDCHSAALRVFRPSPCIACVAWGARGSRLNGILIVPGGAPPHSGHGQAPRGASARQRAHTSAQLPARRGPWQVGARSSLSATPLLLLLGPLKPRAARPQHPEPVAQTRGYACVMWDTCTGALGSGLCTGVPRHTGAPLFVLPAWRPGDAGDGRHHALWFGPLRARSSAPPCSLFVGSGKTALAATIAMDSGFPFIKLVSAVTALGVPCSCTGPSLKMCSLCQGPQPCHHRVLSSAHPHRTSCLLAVVAAGRFLPTPWWD